MIPALQPCHTEWYQYYSPVTPSDTTITPLSHWVISPLQPCHTEWYQCSNTFTLSHWVRRTLHPCPLSDTLTPLWHWVIPLHPWYGMIPLHSCPLSDTITLLSHWVIPLHHCPTEWYHYTPVPLSDTITPLSHWVIPLHSCPTEWYHYTPVPLSDTIIPLWHWVIPLQHWYWNFFLQTHVLWEELSNFLQSMLLQNSNAVFYIWPRTYQCSYNRGRMKWEICLTLPHMTSSVNQTQDEVHPHTKHSCLIPMIWQGLGLWCLMTPGLSTDIRCLVWPYILLNLQVTRSDISQHIKWAVSLLIAYGHFNLPQGFVWVCMG